MSEAGSGLVYRLQIGERLEPPGQQLFLIELVQDLQGQAQIPEQRGAGRLAKSQVEPQAAMLEGPIGTGRLAEFEEFAIRLAAAAGHPGKAGQGGAGLTQKRQRLLLGQGELRDVMQPIVEGHSGRQQASGKLESQALAPDVGIPYQ